MMARAEVMSGFRYRQWTVAVGHWSIIQGTLQLSGRLDDHPGVAAVSVADEAHLNSSQFFTYMEFAEVLI